MGQGLSKEEIFYHIFSVDWHVILNAFFVHHGLRDALLVQYDYGNENLSLDSPPMRNLQLSIRTLFPDLIITPSNEGFYASTVEIPEDIDDDEVKGKLLGYPCASDYSKIIEDKSLDTYFFSLNASLTDSAFEKAKEYGYNIKQKANLLVVRCLSQESEQKMRQLEAKAMNIISQTKKGQFFVKDVFLEIKFKVSEKNLMTHLLEGKELSPDEISEINNDIGRYNLSIEDVNLSNPCNRLLLYTILSFAQSEVSGFLLQFPKEMQDRYFELQDVLTDKLRLVLDASSSLQLC